MPDFAQELLSEPYLVWWGIGVLLIGVEVLVPSTFLLWPGAAAMVLGCVALLFPWIDIRVQVLMWAMLSVAATVFWRTWLRNHPLETTSPLLNRRSAQFIGRRATLTKDFENGLGELRIDDGMWRGRTLDGSSPTAGTTVEVAGTDKAVLLVREVELG